MTEEEKKAIERMTKVRDKKLHTFIEELTIVLNLLKKQQKEIEELKNQTQIISTLYVKENYISKETIRKR